MEEMFTYDNMDRLTGIDLTRSAGQGGDSLRYYYGIDRQRVAQILFSGANVKSKRYFTPLYETVTQDGVTKKLHYLSSVTGLFAIFVTTSTGGEQMYYTFKDHQGSLAAAVHGNTVERLVYDPATASFLSPDRYMQDPTSAQGFNRYAYCMNNPLRFIDPTGYYVTYGGGHKPDGPLQQVVMDGHVGYVLPEVTVIADYENPINHFEFTYEPNNSGGGSGGYLSYGLNSNSPTIGSSGGGGG